MGFLVNVLIVLGVLLLLVPGVVAVTYPDYQGGGFEFAIGFTAFLYGFAALATVAWIREGQ